MALRQGQVQFLVATNVAARGIDVPTITHVFNYGLPMKSEDYTHRIGRTGRAGRDGLAVTLAEFRDKRKIFDIEAYTRQPIAAEVIVGLEPTQRLERGRGNEGFGRKGGGGGGKFEGRRGNSFGGGGGFGGNKFGGNKFGGNSFGGNDRFEGRGDSRSEHRSDNRFDNHAPRGEQQDRGFGGNQAFAAAAPRSFEDRPARGPRQVSFEAGRTPFDKPARAGGKSFGGGFDAKKRTPKPRTAR